MKLWKEHKDITSYKVLTQKSKTTTFIKFYSFELSVVFWDNCIYWASCDLALRKQYFFTNSSQVTTMTPLSVKQSGTQTHLPWSELKVPPPTPLSGLVYKLTTFSERKNNLLTYYQARVFKRPGQAQKTKLKIITSYCYYFRLQKRGMAS